MYKYWMYYLINSDGTNELYAYTDSKAIASKFEFTRNMKMFIKVKRDLSQEDVNYLAYNHKSNILREYIINTKDVKKNEKIQLELVMTEVENLTIGNMEVRLLNMDCDLIETDFLNLMKESGLVFKDKINNAINLLMFNNYPKVVDEFKMFLMYFGKTIIS